MLYYKDQNEVFNMQFKSIFLMIPMFFIVSCSNNDDSTTWSDLKVNFYNEFMPCQAGPDYSQASLSEMMEEWRSLITAEDLVGSWGYAPASDTNSNNNGWWELSWVSKESADAGWEEWLANQDAQAWAARYESVLQCDGEERVGAVFVWPRNPEGTFGEFPDNGTFSSAFFPCTFNEGKGESDLENVLTEYNKWLDTLDSNAGAYAFGLYFPAFETETDMIWGNFHESVDTMKSGNESWEASGGDAKELLEATLSCDNPDLYNSRVLYDPTDPNFS